jgi:protein ImuB
VLWIALHLPLLSLESFAATLSPELAAQPIALMDAHRIVSVNAGARALGVKPGIKRATALALAPQLTLGLADAPRDAQALEAVAHAALAFTPMVAIEPARAAASSASSGLATRNTAATADTVLLDVQASLRYFGGLPALLARLHAALAPLGHRLHTVSAPTALGAALLARVHPQLHCVDLAATCGALAAAPVWLIGPGREHWEALQGMGLRTIADLRVLPRSGLARRFGEAVLSELDRATGTRPDPREPIRLPPSFDSRLELFARADTTEQLLHGAGVLLARLVAWLAAQHAFVRRFSLVMEHERHRRTEAHTPAATTLDIALAEPSRDPAHLLVLLRERLAQLQLPAPTLDLRLHANDITRRAAPNSELFPTPQTEQDGLTRLIERLQARLGTAQVLRLETVADHRPERASRLCAAEARVRPVPARGVAGTTRSARTAHGTHAAHATPADPNNAAAIVRPVWLLAQPEPLPERATGPMLGGQPLQLISGPERIESGWWDAALAERDYFIAQLPGGALVWVYRARLPVQEAMHGWFLQGRFG